MAQNLDIENMYCQGPHCVAMRRAIMRGMVQRGVNEFRANNPNIIPVQPRPQMQPRPQV